MANLTSFMTLRLLPMLSDRGIRRERQLPMNKHHLSKEWLIKKLVFWFWLHMITFVTAWLAYRKYRNRFELTDTAIKFRNGRLTRTITIER